MAKSRRRMRTAPRRGRADWVYRPSVYDEAGIIQEDLGTYEPASATLTPGPTTAFGKVLYDSHNRLTYVADVAGVGLPYTRAGRAEGRNPLILRVQGVLHIQPTTWAVGNSYDICYRIMANEQSAVDGFMSLDTAYSAFDVIGPPMNSPAVFANSKFLIHEKRVFHAFSGGNDTERKTIRFDVRMRRSLSPNFALFLYMESATGSVNVRHRRWLRTLVVDET